MPTVLDVVGKTVQTFAVLARSRSALVGVVDRRDETHATSFQLTVELGIQDFAKRHWRSKNLFRAEDPTVESIVSSDAWEEWLAIARRHSISKQAFRLSKGSMPYVVGVPSNVHHMLWRTEQLAEVIEFAFTNTELELASSSEFASPSSLVAHPTTPLALADQINDLNRSVFGMLLVLAWMQRGTIDEPFAPNLGIALDDWTRGLFIYDLLLNLFAHGPSIDFVFDRNGESISAWQREVDRRVARFREESDAARRAAGLVYPPFSAEDLDDAR